MAMAVSLRMDPFEDDDLLWIAEVCPRATPRAPPVRPPLAALGVGVHLDHGLLPALRSAPALAAFAPTCLPSARTGNRRVWLFSALRAHTKAPYRTDLLWETLRALTRPAGGSRQPIAPRHGRR